MSSGLGFLIVEARNAGDRFDLILAGMAMIGIVGVLLDKGIQAIEDLPGLRWGFAQPSPTASASATERESALAGRAS